VTPRVPQSKDSPLGSPPTALEADAYALAANLPELLVEAHRVAQTITHGLHGRRRAGSGETFWQFRHFEQSDSASAIDWRRSAGSDHLFVREHEWEAAHTIWIWLDVSPSMGFQSHLARITKADRTVVLGLAMAELLSRGGERVGLFGDRPWTGRRTPRRMAEALAQQLAGGKQQTSLPPQSAISRFSECLLISDFIEPLETMTPRFEQLAAQGVRGHLVQVLDPAEETLPYKGRTEFTASEGGERVVAGRAETLREKYQARMSNHREALMEATRRMQWSFLPHHTDRPAEEALLALHARLSGFDADYRYRPATDAGSDIRQEFAKP
jgi:uncharacterized protein (DUF58 family)